MTCGVYRAVSLTTYTTRISEVFTRATVTSSGPALQVDLDLAGSSGGVKAKAILKDLSGAVIKSEELLLKNDGLKSEKVIDWKLNDAVKLWWPTGYGEQNLYILEVTLLDSVSFWIMVGTIPVLNNEHRMISCSICNPSVLASGL